MEKLIERWLQTTGSEQPPYLLSPSACSLPIARISSASLLSASLPFHRLDDAMDLLCIFRELCPRAKKAVRLSLDARTLRCALYLFSLTLDLVPGQASMARGKVRRGGNPLKGQSFVVRAKFSSSEAKPSDFRKNAVYEAHESQTAAHRTPKPT